MGIDIYAQWKGQTETEERAQITGFSIAHGHVGYLREAYHGEPYATRVLVPEAFETEHFPDGAPIAAATLKARLSEAQRVATERERIVYRKERYAKETRMIRKSLRDFVALCEKQERETGEPCRIVASY
jgi:hypothetical protein